MSTRGWIGVDLDATLAEYSGWKGEKHVGEPVPKMLQRVKDWIAAGKTVKILTARVSARDQEEVAYNVAIIQDWCEKHGLPRLEVTCRKDYAMVEMWDDRCKQVIPNTGQTVEEFAADAVEKNNKLSDAIASLENQLSAIRTELDSALRVRR